MTEARDSSESRASRRGSWPVRKVPLGQEPTDDLRETTTAEQRIAMVWQLTLDTWASMGRPLPTYERRDAPVRKFHRRVG